MKKRNLLIICKDNDDIFDVSDIAEIKKGLKQHVNFFISCKTLYTQTHVKKVIQTLRNNNIYSINKIVFVSSHNDNLKEVKRTFSHEYGLNQFIFFDSSKYRKETTGKELRDKGITGKRTADNAARITSSIIKALTRKSNQLIKSLFSIDALLTLCILLFVVANLILHILSISSYLIIFLSAIFTLLSVFLVMVFKFRKKKSYLFILSMYILSLLFINIFYFNKNITNIKKIDKIEKEKVDLYALTKIRFYEIRKTNNKQVRKLQMTIIKNEMKIEELENALKEVEESAHSSLPAK